MKLSSKVSQLLKLMNTHPSDFVIKVLSKCTEDELDILIKEYEEKEKVKKEWQAQWNELETDLND